MVQSLKNGCARFNIALTDDHIAAFERYAELLLEWNEKINLTAITSLKEIALKHFVDSLIGEKHFPQGATVCDVGTGAGFPGVPLQIYRPDLHVTLMDALNKRLVFLEEVIHNVCITFPQCVHNRAEEAGQNPAFRERFDVVTARAVARMATLLEYTLPLVKVGGKLVLYKGHCDEELEEAKFAIKELGGKYLQKETYFLTENSDLRTIVVIEKVAKTPAKYPRGAGKERSKPLLAPKK